MTAQPQITVDRDWFSPNTWIVLVDGHQIINQYFETQAEAEAFAAALRTSGNSLSTEPVVATYQAAVAPAADGFDTMLNGGYVGTFPTPDQAWQEATAAAVADARTLAVPAANPLIPFGVAGGPAPDLSSLTLPDLDRAGEALADFYERTPRVVQRVVDALDITHEVLNEIGAGLPDGERRFVIDAGGDCRVRGSTTYWTNDNGCTCKDFFVRAGEHQGLCKHVLAREILRLAQARRVVYDAASGNHLAYITIAARRLARAIRALPANERITLTIVFHRLRLTGDTQSVKQINHLEGWGCRSVTLSATDARALARALWTYTVDDHELLVQLFVDESDATVSVCGGGFHTAYRTPDA
jgi:hypothetical protein